MTSGKSRLWQKNLLFAAVCLAGLVGVGTYLLRRERVESPQSFWPERFQPASLSSGGILKPPPTDNDWSNTLGKLNAEFAQSWQAQGLEHAPRADDLTIARRLSLALTGSVPS